MTMTADIYVESQTDSYESRYKNHEGEGIDDR